MKIYDTFGPNPRALSANGSDSSTRFFRRRRHSDWS